MAKWKRRKSRTAAAGLNRYYSAQGNMIQPGSNGDDGATGAGTVGVGERCNQPVAACAELASCAPVVLEAEGAEAGTQGSADYRNQNGITG